MHSLLYWQVQAKYSSEQEFRLHETKPTVDRIRAEVEAARHAELKFDGVRAKPVGPSVLSRLAVHHTLIRLAHSAAEPFTPPRLCISSGLSSFTC